MSVQEIKPNRRNKYQALWEMANGIFKVQSTPPNLQIAKSNICNFKCVYCIDHRVGNEIPRTKNEGTTWENLLQLIPKSEMLSFHGISEFMVDPEFLDTVQRCAEAGVTLSLNTNGSVAAPKYLSALANYPHWLSINFSIDAATPETFLRIRGKEFWRVVQNIKTYIDLFEERRDRTEVTLSFVVTKSSVQDMMPLIYLAKALKVNGVRYYHLHQGDWLDWQVETKTGDIFDYRAECTDKFIEEFKIAAEHTRKAAEVLGVHIELPAPPSEFEEEEGESVRHSSGELKILQA